MPREFCEYCRVPMTIPHLLQTCVNFDYSRRGIKSYLRKYNLPLTEQVLLGDDLPHTLLFQYLKYVKYVDRI